MAEQLDPNDLVTIDELALTNMWETSALVELLERKGILTKQEVLDMIQELRQRERTRNGRSRPKKPVFVPRSAPQQAPSSSLLTAGGKRGT